MPYVSPYGKLAGVRERMVEHRRRLGCDKTLPWVGMGLIDDLEAIVRLLNLREFAEHLRVNGTPEQQAFANEILVDQETLDAANDAMTAAGYPETDVVKGIELLTEEARDLFEVRQVLADVGALAEDDEQTPVADILRALLS